VADLSKRYGNLKNGIAIFIMKFFENKNKKIGANDIKKHRYFNDIDWNLLI